MCICLFGATGTLLENKCGIIPKSILRFYKKRHTNAQRGGSVRSTHPPLSLLKDRIKRYS